MQRTPPGRGAIQSSFDRRFSGELEFKKFKTNHLKIGTRNPPPRSQAVQNELLDGPSVAKVEPGFWGCRPVGEQGSIRSHGHPAILGRYRMAVLSAILSQFLPTRWSCARFNSQEGLRGPTRFWMRLRALARTGQPMGGDPSSGTRPRWRPTGHLRTTGGIVPTDRRPGAARAIGNARPAPVVDPADSSAAPTLAAADNRYHTRLKAASCRTSIAISRNRSVQDGMEDRDGRVVQRSISPPRR